jgi:hypothetical protein
MPLVALGVVIVLAGFAFGLLIAIVHVLWLSLPVIALTVAGIAAANRLPRLFTPRWATLRESLTPAGSLDALHWRIGSVTRPPGDWKVAGYVVGSFALFKGISIVDSLGWAQEVRFHFFSSESTVDSRLTLFGIGLFGFSAGVVAIGRLRWRLTTDEFIDNAERRFGLGPRAPILNPEQSSALLGLERVLLEQGPLRESAAVSSPLVAVLTRHGRSTGTAAALRDPPTVDGIVRQVEDWARREADAIHRLDALIFRLAVHAPSASTRLMTVVTADGRGFRCEDIADEVADVVVIAEATRSLPSIDAAIDKLRDRLRTARTDAGNRVKP